MKSSRLFKPGLILSPKGLAALLMLLALMAVIGVSVYREHQSKAAVAAVTAAPAATAEPPKTAETTLAPAPDADGPAAQCVCPPRHVIPRNKQANLTHKEM